MDFKKVGLIVGINLLVLVGYTAVLGCLKGLNHLEALGFAFMMMILLGIHALVAISGCVIMFVQKKNTQGLGFLMAFLAVVLIGPFACLGGADNIF